MGLTLKDVAKNLMKGEIPLMASPESAEIRLGECSQCEHFRKISRQCVMCGCFLDLKTKLLEASCPIGKW